MTEDELKFFDSGVFLYWASRTSVRKFEQLIPEAIDMAFQDLIKRKTIKPSSTPDEFEGKTNDTYRARTKYFTLTGKAPQYWIILGAQWGDESQQRGPTVLIYGYVGTEQQWFPLHATAEFQVSNEGTRQYLCEYLTLSDDPAQKIMVRWQRLLEELIKQIPQK